MKCIGFFEFCVIRTLPLCTHLMSCNSWCADPPPFPHPGASWHKCFRVCVSATVRTIMDTIPRISALLGCDKKRRQNTSGAHFYCACIYLNSSKARVM